jgi:hypothetical protein
MHLEIYPDFPVYLSIVFKVVPMDPLDFIGICCDLPMFISDFINLALFRLPSSQIG